MFFHWIESIRVIGQSLGVAQREVYKRSRGVRCPGSRDCVVKQYRRVYVRASIYSLWKRETQNRNSGPGRDYKWCPDRRPHVIASCISIKHRELPRETEEIGNRQKRLRVTLACKLRTEFFPSNSYTDRESFSYVSRSRYFCGFYDRKFYEKFFISRCNGQYFQETRQSPGNYKQLEFRVCEGLRNITG